MAQKRLHSHDSNVGIEFASVARIDAHQGAGGAHGGHQGGDPVPGLLPDLGCGFVIVGIEICFTVVLIGHEIPVRVFARQAVDLFNGAVGPQVRRVSA